MKWISNVLKSLSYNASLSLLVVLVCFSLLVLSYCLNCCFNVEYYLIGEWFTLIGVIFFGMTWGSPEPIVANDRVGIDNVPNKDDRVLINDSYKNFSLWDQPNRLKLYTSFIALSFGQFIVVFSETFLT